MNMKYLVNPLSYFQATNQKWHNENELKNQDE